MTRTAIISKPTKTAMQSGTGKTNAWVLSFVSQKPKALEHIMGWTGSTEMDQEVALSFPTQDEAIRYAEKNGITYVVQAPKSRKLNIRAYADNFSFQRIKT
jgi:hypothetical protein